MTPLCLQDSQDSRANYTAQDTSLMPGTTEVQRVVPLVGATLSPSSVHHRLSPCIYLLPASLMSQS